jgi:cell division protein ZapA (FtsZ GTPase activity inhibitor)
MDEALNNFNIISSAYVSKIIEDLKKNKKIKIDNNIILEELFQFYFNPSIFGGSITHDNKIKLKSENFSNSIKHLQDAGLINFISNNECLLPDYFMLNALKNNIKLLPSFIMELLISTITSMKIFGNIKGIALQIIVAILISEKKSNLSEYILEQIKSKIETKNKEKIQSFIKSDYKLELFQKRNEELNKLKEGYVLISRDGQSPLEINGEIQKFPNEPIDILFPILDLSLLEENETFNETLNENISKVLYPVSIQVTCQKDNLKDKEEKFFNKMKNISESNDDILHDCIAIFLSIHDYTKLDKNKTWFLELKNEEVVKNINKDLNLNILDLLNTQSVETTLQNLWNFLEKKSLVKKTYNLENFTNSTIKIVSPLKRKSYYFFF